MAFRVEFSVEAERDFEIIFDFLTESYRGFGEGIEEALEHAQLRIEDVRKAAGRLGRMPHRGTLHDSMLPGLRHVTVERAVFWFDVDDASATVRILAVFLGGQDHHRQMIARLLGDATPLA